MAILITDNLLIDHPVTITGTGAAWQHLDRLTTPQLAPAATWGNGTTVRLELQLGQSINAADGWALVLLGASADVMTDFRWQRSGSAISPPYIHTLDAPIGQHLVVGIDQNSFWSPTELRVRWSAGGSPGTIGGLYLGRLHDAPELADAGWSISYPDQRASAASYGGQIYHASDQPLIAREARIPMGLLPESRAVTDTDSLADIHTRHGHTRPIIAMPRPSQANVNRTTGIYGHITGGSTITHRNGPYYGSALRITEAL